MPSGVHDVIVAMCSHTPMLPCACIKDFTCGRVCAGSMGCSGVEHVKADSKAEARPDSEGEFEACPGNMSPCRLFCLAFFWHQRLFLDWRAPSLLLAAVEVVGRAGEDELLSPPKLRMLDTEAPACRDPELGPSRGQSR